MDPSKSISILLLYCVSVETGNETRKREEWDLVRRIAHPCLSPLADSYLTIVSDAENQIWVNRAAPLLENTIIDLRSDSQSRARVAALLAAVSL